MFLFKVSKKFILMRSWSSMRSASIQMDWVLAFIVLRLIPLPRHHQVQYLHLSWSIAPIYRCWFPIIACSKDWIKFKVGINLVVNDVVPLWSNQIDEVLNVLQVLWIQVLHLVSMSLQLWALQHELFVDQCHEPCMVWDKSCQVEHQVPIRLHSLVSS